MWMLNSDLNYIIRILVLTGLLCSFVPAVRGSAGCGGYITLTAGETRAFGLAPGYEPYSHCIWVIQAAEMYKAKMYVMYFTGQALAGTCVDYFVVRDGSATETELVAQTCSVVQNENVTATARWLWMEFVSDGDISSSHLSVIITTEYSGVKAIDEIASPHKACKSYEVECPNTVCIPRAYICDGFNDCGCVEDCDEQDCEGLGIEKGDLLALSAGIGVGLFILIFIVVWLWERRRRRIAKQKEREDRMKEEGRGRPSKNKKDDKKDKKAKRKKKEVYWIS